MKKVLIAVLVVAMVVSCVIGLAACGEDNSKDYEYIKEKGTLVVGVTDYEPMDFVENGVWTGFDAELAKLVGAELGVKVEFVEIDWEQKITELKSKKIDVIWNGMTVTEKLGKSMDFSYSYAQNYQAVVVRSENLSKYATIDKIKAENARVAVESSSAGERVAKEEFAEDKVIGLQGQIKALEEVVLRTSNVAIVDYTMAASKCGKGSFEDLRIVPGLAFETEEFAVGIRKGSNLTAKINELLVKYYKDGTIENLRKQFGEDSIALCDLSNK